MKGTSESKIGNTVNYSVGTNKKRHLSSDLDRKVWWKIASPNVCGLKRRIDKQGERGAGKSLTQVGLRHIRDIQMGGKCKCVEMRGQRDSREVQTDARQENGGNGEGAGSNDA